MEEFRAYLLDEKEETPKSAREMSQSKLESMVKEITDKEETLVE